MRWVTEVVYPLHGGAIIKDIEAHIQDGETVKYYILQMLFDNMTVSVPVRKAPKIRFTLYWR